MSVCDQFAEDLQKAFLGGTFNDINRLLAGGRGFEPRLTGPEPVVLPLDDPPTGESILVPRQTCVKTICDAGPVSLSEARTHQALRGG
jgi:hypothetical protein